MRGYQPNLSQGTFFQLTPPHIPLLFYPPLVKYFRKSCHNMSLRCRADTKLSVWLKFTFGSLSASVQPWSCFCNLVLLAQVIQSYFSLTHWDLLHFFFNCCCCTEVPNNQMDNHKVHAVDIKWHFISEVFAKVFLYLLIRRKENWYPVIKMVKWCMWHVPDMWSENRIPAYPHL